MTVLHPSAPSDWRATRRAVLAAVLAAIDSLHESDPRERNDALENALGRARTAAGTGRDGTEGRAAAAIRTACAYHSARQPEDTFFALQSARDHLES